MYTRDSALLSTEINRIITDKNATLGAFFKPPFSKYVQKLFSNGEQGFFYDPNDLSTMFQDAARTVPVTGAGQPVGFVLDKSGRGNHASQTTSASRPILRQNAVTGAYYLEFDGVDDRLTTNSFPSMGLATTIFAGSYSQKASTSTVVARGTGGYLYQTSGVVAVQSVSKPVIVLMSGNAVITVKYEGSGTGVTLKANNASRTESTTDRGFNAANPLVIGAFSNGGEVPLQGHIYCLIGISKLTTDAESIAIEKELAKRTGVTLNV